jgi:predicted TIM-barrel fold metal-dependent hydrolase
VSWSFVPSDDVARIRARLDHPVVDSDGHLIEFLPLVRDFVAEEAGPSVAADLDRIIGGPPALDAVPVETRRAKGLSRSPWWGLPTENTLDRATAMFPKLFCQRMDELGIDFAVVYPTFGLVVTAFAGEELRRAMARALNRYYAEVYGPYRDRLAPVACIPCFTPDEALDELDHALGLGLRAVMLAGVIPRPVPGADGVRWLDTLGHEATYDYEPLWAALERHDVAATFHASGMGWGSRISTSNYVYNHIGNFAAAGEATARSLLFAGVPIRHPQLRFAFQEGGVAAAASLAADVIGHWEKRNTAAIGRYDPAALDRSLLGSLFDDFASGPVAGMRARLEEGLGFLSQPGTAADDEFAASGITGRADVERVFSRQFHFGCEADDPLNALAFADGVVPGGLRAVFASDIGHWDVPDARAVLVEAWEGVEHGALSEQDFRAFVFGNAVSLWGRSFFAGTAVEGSVA